MDPLSFATGALTATLAVTLARVVRGLRLAQPPRPPQAPVTQAIDVAGRPGTAPLAFLAGVAADHIASRLMREPPYLAAYVLEQLEPAFAHQVLASLGEVRRGEVLELLRSEHPLKVSGEAFIALLGRLRQADAPHPA
ncbi:MAG: hypothetical protein VKS61_05480 [Candidatus Sericytochromatia bacterium]|nr:hypothetical protein [Candidatus Sericytochromatia bacterium]